MEDSEGPKLPDFIDTQDSFYPKHPLDQRAESYNSPQGQSENNESEMNNTLSFIASGN